MSGPYYGSLDLCNYVSYTNVHIDINFDINSGVFVWDTDDSGTFPPGVYTFMIQISIGVTVQEAYFTLTIIAHCDVPVLTINTQVSVEVIYYHIGSSSMVIFSYN